MSERYTKKDATKAFEWLCEITGHRIARNWDDVGGWQLDSNPTYGGYVVEEIVNEHGAVSRPLGDQRRSAREFYDVVWFATRLIQDREQMHKQATIDPKVVVEESGT